MAKMLPLEMVTGGPFHPRSSERDRRLSVATTPAGGPLVDWGGKIRMIAQLERTVS